MEQIIDKFRKNAVEEVRATLSEYRGHQFFSLRVWTEVEGGKWVPTKKGLTLKTDLFPEFSKAVEKIKAALVETGLLDLEDLEVEVSNGDPR